MDGRSSQPGGVDGASGSVGRRPPTVAVGRCRGARSAAGPPGWWRRAPRCPSRRPPVAFRMETAYGGPDAQPGTERHGGLSWSGADRQWPPTRGPTPMTSPPRRWTGLNSELMDRRSNLPRRRRRPGLPQRATGGPASPGVAAESCAGPERHLRAAGRRLHPAGPSPRLGDQGRAGPRHRADLPGRAHLGSRAIGGPAGPLRPGPHDRTGGREPPYRLRPRRLPLPVLRRLPPRTSTTSCPAAAVGRTPGTTWSPPADACNTRKEDRLPARGGYGPAAQPVGPPPPGLAAGPLRGGQRGLAKLSGDGRGREPATDRVGRRMAAVVGVPTRGWHSVGVGRSWRIEERVGTAALLHEAWPATVDDPRTPCRCHLSGVSTRSRPGIDPAVVGCRWRARRTVGVGRDPAPVRWGSGAGDCR